MKNEPGQIIYVGKAKNLRNRVSSYFQSRGDKGMRTIKMVEQISDIEYVVVDTELEALLLETNFIKELRPKYNILMKDDKNYVYIKITVDEPYPRIFLTRKVLKDKARYFGPKTAAHKVIKTLKVLKQLFPFRHCQLQIDYVMPEKEPQDLRPGAGRHQVKVTKASIKYPCLDYHIKRCIGPCIGTVSPEEYRKIIDQVIRFLEGRHEEIIEKIKAEMIQAAEEKKFEKAAALRDKIKNIEEILETQRISDPHQKDLDILHYVIQDEKAYFNLFQLREGKLVGQENFVLAASGATTQNGEPMEDREILMAFLEQYYEKATDLPKEILVPHEIDDQDTMERWLSDMKGQKVSLIVPELGKKNHLLELSLSNAQSFAKQSQIKWQGAEKGIRQKALEELQQLLHLSKPPKRLECYDISHFSGTETVSSMVVFENGFPKKDDYRKFKLHQQDPGAPNDFASMEETLTRRLKYLKPSVARTGLKIRKAKNKEREKFIQQCENEAGADFFVIEKDKKQEGFMIVKRYPSSKILLQKLETNLSEDREFFFKFLLSKYKIKRLYAHVPLEQQPVWETLGFEQLKKNPEEFLPESEKIYLVFDRHKYQEDPSFKKIPDLIIIDGGKGQLSSAQKALQKYQLQIPMISIAKREEEFFLPNESESIQLTKDDPISLLIQHIRDEAHRFAVTYHQNLRLKDEMGSVLDTIPGIGPQMKLKLLKKFGSVDGIRQANQEELAQLIGEKAAKKLKVSL